MTNERMTRAEMIRWLEDTISTESEKPFEEIDCDFVDECGQRLGRHRGVAAYTIGQRKGLGIAFGEPRFVVDKDAAANTVTLGKSEALFSTGLLAENANWIAIPALHEPLRVTAKTRYQQKEALATVYPEGENGFRLVFDEPQRALTAGQAVVLYQEDVVVGGGTIVSAVK